MKEKNNSSNEKKNPVPLKEMNILFYSEDKIDEFAYELIKILFDIDALYLSGQSELGDFLISRKIEGHVQIEFNNLSDEDKQLYPWVFEDWTEEDRQKLIVDFPPITDEVRRIYFENERKMLIQQIEQIFGLSMRHYPTEEKLFVWKVAKYILAQQRLMGSIDTI